ncbi:MAG: hypothetical protein EZS28_053356 [Streblomastix strix]|uniref:Uncharacterized protein n=1 Tax=Streblomastix strix TaxID=222440 RepID=A0A5J4RDH1_9EUKA|nr:MAG: hypothetical protein EZS28_053356 [Streblomastix strix]
MFVIPSSHAFFNYYYYLLLLFPYYQYCEDYIQSIEGILEEELDEDDEEDGDSFFNNGEVKFNYEGGVYSTLELLLLLGLLFAFDADFAEFILFSAQFKTNPLGRTVVFVSSGEVNY